MQFNPIERRNSYDSNASSSQTGLLSETKTIIGDQQSSSWITPRILSDFTIGLSDGLTVPFALTAGLSALGNGGVVVSAGFAELVAGAISMGVAGYLGAKGERDAQLSSLRQHQELVKREPEEAIATVRAKLEEFALPTELLNHVTNYYTQAPHAELLELFTRCQQDEFQAPILRPWLTGSTIATAYLFGGFVPLVPYIFMDIGHAFFTSVVITATVLFSFGCAKGPMSGATKDLRGCLRSGAEMLLLGGLAAAAALLSVRILNISKGQP